MPLKKQKKSNDQKEEKNNRPFCVKLIKTIEKNKLLSELFSALDYKSALNMLYSMGEKDALSYLDKKILRKSAYITAKKPSILFKNSFTENEEACADLLLYWISNIIRDIIDDFSASELDEIKAFIEEESIDVLVKSFDIVIHDLIKGNELWRAGLATGCFLNIPTISELFSELEQEDFLNQLPEPSNEFLDGIIYKVRSHFEHEQYKIKSNILKLKRQYKTLAEKYLKTSTELMSFRDFPSINLLKETRATYKKFNNLRELIVKYCEKLSGFNYEEEKEYKTLDDLIKLADEIEEYEDKGHEQNKRFALDVLDKAKQIHLNGTQDDESIRVLIEKIHEARELVKTDLDIVQALLSKKHPFSLLVNLIEEPDQPEKTVYGELLEKLNEYCGSSVCTALVSGLMLEKLTLGEKPEVVHVTEDKVEPPKDKEVKPPKDKEIEPPKDKEIELPKDEDKVARPKHTIKSFIKVGSLNELATLLQAEDTEENWHNLLWLLIAEDDLSGAYWLSRSLSAAKGKTPLPDWLLASAQGSRWLSSDSDAFVGDLLEFTKNFQPNSDDVHLLIGLATALRPTLIAPFSGLISWLKAPGKYSSFTSLVKIVNEYAKLSVALRPEDIHGLAGVDQLEASIIDAVDSTQRWMDNALKKRVKLKRATEIWKHLLSTKGNLRSFLTPVIEDNRAKVKQVKLQLQKWQRYDYKSEQIRKADLELSKHKVRPIIGSPKQHLVRNIKEANELAKRWCNLVEHGTEIEMRGDWFFEQVAQLRESIQNILPDVLTTLNELTQPIQPTPIVAAAYCLRRSTDQLIETLNLQDKSSKAELTIANSWRWMTRNSSNLKIALSRRLLYMPEVTLSDNSQPSEEAVRNICLNLRDSISQERSLRTAVEIWIEKQDYRFVEIMTNAFDEKDSTEPIPLFQDSLNGSRSVLNDSITETDSFIEQALVDGIIPDEKRSMYNANVEKVKYSENLNFHARYEELRKIREEISNERLNRLEELEHEWSNLESLLDESNIEKNQKKQFSKFVTDSIKRKDTRIVEECLARLSEAIDTGIELEESLFKYDTEVDVLAEFLKNASKVERWITNSKSLKKIEDNIRNGDTRANIKFGHLPKKRLEEAAKAISHWRNLKKHNPNAKGNSHDIGMLMLYLGFNLDHRMGDSIRIKEKGLDWIFCRASMSAGDLAKPIPQFGSKTQDKYDIICLWERPGADTIAARLRNLRLSFNNVIVLYLGRLTERQRRDLIRMRHEQALAIALLDETLTVYLAKEWDTSNRLKTFLCCALPYAIVDPYTPFQAGDVPREMFFGRNEMVKELQRMGGSCLVYGGRQLGKSALLRHVQREFHNPDREQYAWVLDIKLIGDPKTMQPTQHIWIKIRDCLKDLGLISKRIITAKPNEIRRYLKESIQENKERRIIILFDEADNFLESDSKENFIEVERLRTLITDTEYRFKVTFAGLHNVQRYQGIPNQPLAHFGAPICVGPLEPKAAQQLVQQPLEVLGYRFADRGSTILRILSYTNYHPGLIQIFCQELLKRLQTRTISSSPPYKIVQEDIEAIYLLPEVRTRISERFNWTLALHPHYQAIAWLLILDQMETRDSYAIAYPPGDILKLARDWWRDEFREVAMDELRGILDEMCGLGILVKNFDGHYRLRSPNLVRLMGTDESIMANLDELMGKKIHLPFDADNHHIPLDDLAHRYSPLSFSQERSMNKQQFGISLVFSSEVLGLSLFPKSLEKFLPSDLPEKTGVFINLPSEVITKKEMLEYLKHYNKEYAKYQTVIIYCKLTAIDSNDLEKTIREALDFCRIHKSHKRWLRLNFLFDPQVTWAWLSLPKKVRDELENQVDATVFSRRWNLIGISQRLAQSDKIHSDEACKKVLEVTGGWHYLLDVLFDRCREEDDIRPFAMELKSELLDPKSNIRQQFISYVGLEENITANRILTFLAELDDEEIPFDLISEFVENELLLTSEECGIYVEYLTRLNCITFHGDTVALEPIIRNIIFQT